MDAANVELEAAIPAMEAAREAVDCLDVKAIQEFKGYANPPGGTDDVASAVQILFGVKEERKRTWPSQQKMMNPPPQFIQTLKDYNKEEIKDWQKVEVGKLLAKDYFNYKTMLGKSSAAANLANWVINVVRYNAIYVNVKPLQEEAERAEKEANEKNEELRIVKERGGEIVAKVNELKAQLDEAVAKKEAVEAKAAKLQTALDLANRLVNGLADENVRWKSNVETSKHDKLTMIGNALIAAAFVSYIGPFSSNFRTPLWKEQWTPDIIELKIPFTEGVDPLDVLSSPSE